MTTETYHSGRIVTAAYMPGGGGLTSIADASRTYASAINYTAHGAMSTETLGNNAIQTMAFNDRLQLSQINLVKSGTELQRYDYSYGQYDANNTTLDATKNNGQIAKIEGFIGGAKQWEQRHTYDSLGRLSVAGEYRGDNNLVSWRTHYGYDRFGNRYQNTSQTQNTGLSYVNVANADINRTTNRFASGITYDDGGNVTNDNKFKANVSFAYNANNRVVSTNNGAMTAVYNGIGQRVCSTVAGITTTSVYDASGQLIAEYNGTTLIREYIGDVATVEGTTVRYLTSNHLGSNSVVMNDTGGVVARHDYLPFGEEIAANTGMRTGAQGYGVSDPTRTKFAGMERENANGLDHTLYRKAETKSGRWNSPDPYNGSMKLVNPQSFNRYSYVENNPISFVDPYGLCLVEKVERDCITIDGVAECDFWYVVIDDGKPCGSTDPKIKPTIGPVPSRSGSGTTMGPPSASVSGVGARGIDWDGAAPCLADAAVNLVIGLTFALTGPVGAGIGLALDLAGIDINPFQAYANNDSLVEPIGTTDLIAGHTAVLGGIAQNTYKGKGGDKALKNAEKILAKPYNYTKSAVGKAGTAIKGLKVAKGLAKIIPGVAVGLELVDAGVSVNKCLNRRRLPVRL